ncbi:AprI/Inh family metalloprotease inhibitor [Methylobacterium sp. J-090]|uniref:AprI/Inh family metalloprotease inhibitor n=1 Tax=Methylobacterium sp. J-090 TaxID=2836666 RepID=UPI001FB950BB|nr:AprI/Inh family metalloprotease inhibitor [Methylobacterium sp. J-090]MCJ2084038.1 protease inhibitor Inh/omp19 family protein [Methylobacterium sp. J-090]
MSAAASAFVLGFCAALAVGGTAVAQEAQPSQAVRAPTEAPVSEAVPAQPFIESLPKDIAGVPGTWDLSRDGSTRRCVMTLSSESGEAGRRLSFPAGCRRALPVLNGVAGWLFTDGALRFVDKNVRPVLPFTRRPDARSLVAQLESGEHYSLVPLQIVAMVPSAPAVPPAPGTPTSPSGTPTSAPLGAETDLGGAAPPAGLYTLDRYRDPDVCRLELTQAPPPAPVRVLDGCRDSGLSVFDPVSWQFARGRLVLNARRGHTVNLIPTGDGRWRRDPEVGVTFVLRRITTPSP